MYSADYLGQLAVSLDLALVKRGLTLEQFSAELGCTVAELVAIRERQADPPFSLAMKILGAADFPNLMADPQLSRMESKLDTLLTPPPPEDTPDIKAPFLSAESKDRLAAVGAEVGEIIAGMDLGGDASHA